MFSVHCFVFNAFQENTFIAYDATGCCVIIDPGCSNTEEENELMQFLHSKKLNPVWLLNTHAHLDHMAGNDFVIKNFNTPLCIHEKELPVLRSAPEVGRMYGVQIAPSPDPSRFISDGDEIQFGQTLLRVIFTPGHSPGEVSFFEPQNKILFAGDVLFNGSIGRFDFPQSDYETLMNSIFKKLLPLGDDVTVYSGHGITTTLGKEKRTNPFLLEYANQL